MYKDTTDIRKHAMLGIKAKERQYVLSVPYWSTYLGGAPRDYLIL